MSKKFITIRELIDSGRMLFPDVFSALRNGSLNAHSNYGPVKFLSLVEEGKTPAFNKWGQWTPNEEEKALHKDRLKWEGFLKKAWGIIPCVPLSVIDQIGPFPDNDPDFLPMPADNDTAKKMGLVGNNLKDLIMVLRVPLGEIEVLEGNHPPLSGREEATYLKIMRGLMLALNIKPESRDATSRVKAILEREGIEVDDETIRQRIMKLRGKKT